MDQDAFRSELPRVAGQKDDSEVRRDLLGPRDAERRDDLAHLVADAWAGRDAGRLAGLRKVKDHDYQWASVRDSLLAAVRDSPSARDAAVGRRDALNLPLRDAAGRLVVRELVDVVRAHRRFGRLDAKVDREAQAPVAVPGAFAERKASPPRERALRALPQQAERVVAQQGPPRGLRQPVRLEPAWQEQWARAEEPSVAALLDAQEPRAKLVLALAAQVA